MDDFSLDVIVISFIAGAMLVVPVMVLAYTGVAATRWIWKDKTV